MIPYARQSINDDDIRAVIEVLQSDWLTQGPTSVRFEEIVAQYCGAAHAVSTNSGTSALHVAYLALGLGPGDILWTSPITFVATANAALYCGANVDFVDIDPRTYNLSVDALKTKLEIAERTGKLPKIVAPVHFTGQPCAMADIRELGDRYGFKIVEDASHALGASYRDSTIGDCRYCDIAILSFHPVKIITTAEGGMATTQDQAIADKMRRLRSHGITSDRNLFVKPDEGPWYYEQHELGFNYRLTDLQAALGLSQIARASAFVKRRRAVAARYNETLADLPVIRPWQAPHAQSAWHLYMVGLDQGHTGQRRRVVEGMRAAGIFAHVHYIPVHLQPYYARLGFRYGDFPQAERYYQSAITLPMHADLRPDEQDQVVKTLADCLTGDT